MTAEVTPVPSAELRLRATEGVSYLDGLLGKSWVHRIDADNIIMHDVDSCVLGQIQGEADGGYGGFIFQYRLFEEDSFRYGFDLPSCETFSDDNWWRLTNVWRNLIAELVNDRSFKPGQNSE